MTGLLLGAAVALTAAAETARSPDGAFAVALLDGWAAPAPQSGRMLDLGRPRRERLLVAGDWHDGSLEPPPAAIQARLRGAPAGRLGRKSREGQPFSFSRTRTEEGVRLLGWFPCLGDRYLFEARVSEEAAAWRLLDTFRCERPAGPAAAGTSVRIGRTGWSVVMPPGFRLERGDQDGLMTWVRSRKDAQNYDIVEQQILLRTESAAWSPARPWNADCKSFMMTADRGGLTELSQGLRQGKTYFQYRCDWEGYPAYAYDLAYDYDAEFGTARFIAIRLQHYTREVAESPARARIPPPETLFRELLGSLVRKGLEPAPAAPEPPRPAAVPLLR